MNKMAAYIATEGYAQLNVTNVKLPEINDIMIFNKSLVVCISVWLVSGQRPQLSTLKPPNSSNLSVVTEDSFGNSTEGLPVEDRSNTDVGSRVQDWPIESQPFWYINRNAKESKPKNPQT